MSGINGWPEDTYYLGKGMDRKEASYLDINFQ